MLGVVAPTVIVDSRVHNVVELAYKLLSVKALELPLRIEIRKENVNSNVLLVTNTPKEEIRDVPYHYRRCFCLFRILFNNVLGSREVVVSGNVLGHLRNRLKLYPTLSKRKRGTESEETVYIECDVGRNRCTLFLI
jgi:hypothetical protein